jgi:hypothetical protein
MSLGGMIFFNDMVFNGGLNGFSLHISQVVMRNLTFNKCVNGIVFRSGLVHGLVANAL